MHRLDEVDFKILRRLQMDGRISNQALAEAVNLSAAPCLRRVKRLEEAGVIKGYFAQVDQGALGLDLMAFVHVSLNDHQPDSIQRLDDFVRDAEAIVEGYSVSGEYDFLLKVVVKDMAAMEQFLIHDLMALQTVRSANTTFVLRERKHSGIPLP